MEIFPGDARRVGFKDAEIALQILRQDMHIRKRMVDKDFLPKHETPLDHFLVWNRLDSPSNPFCTKEATGKFLELKKGQQFIIFGEDPYGGANFRASMDDENDASEFHFTLKMRVLNYLF